MRLIDRFIQHEQSKFLIWRDTAYSYQWLSDAVNTWEQKLCAAGIAPGAIVMLEGDFSPQSIAAMLALLNHRCIIAPLTQGAAAQENDLLCSVPVDFAVKVEETDQGTIQFLSSAGLPHHQLLAELSHRRHPGLILLTSGSTGKAKAVLHDFEPFLEKFKFAKHPLRTIGFLLFDHVAGLDTLFYVLASGGCLIALPDRAPETVCTLIEKYKAQVLPTSPSFINLLLLSESYQHFDLSSLEIITYGAEVMPEGVLQKLHQLYPDIRVLQKYGVSELGALRVQSRSFESTWIKLAGLGFSTRIVNGLLEIKTQSAMLGYLNAPSPFTEDGWFQTGDAVEVQGEYIRILGRMSDMINVGGEKVYPAEVENVIQMMDGVEEVVVCAETNPILGQIIKAVIKVNTGETVSKFRRRMHEFCFHKLPPYKIPQKVQLAEQALHNTRYKKTRIDHKDIPGTE
jgi:acyl-CoA synthetase (AMP-forming)/AMP-acid ligase II